MTNGVAVLIPCYNAAGFVGPVVAAVRPLVSTLLVVDDGSSDGSGAEAERAGAELRTRPKNGGKGAALKDGIAELLRRPGVSHVLFMDADGQHAPSDVPKFLDAAKRGETFVIGSRFGDRSKIPGKRYWTNYIGSRVLSRMTGQELEDTQSGFRLIATDVLRQVAPRLRSTGYAVESEILIKASPLGIRVTHVPIEVIYDGNPSHFRPFQDTWAISWLCVGFKVFGDEE